MLPVFASLLLAIHQIDHSQVQSSSITIRDPAVPVSRALAEIRRQTNILVQDGRGGKDDAIALDLNHVTFWQALDAIAAAANARVTAGQDGVLQLKPRAAADRSPQLAYDGEFRVRLAGVLARRDFDPDRAATVFTLEVTWTPTVRPLFLEANARGVRLVDLRNKAVSVVEERGSLAPVDGRPSFTVEVTTPLLPRADPRVSLLEGTLIAVAPSKFLTFRYDADLASLKDAVAGGEVRRLAQDDVVCRVDRVVLDKERWSVTLALDYPAGGKALESFQASSLVVNNELLLTSRDGKRTLAPTGHVVEAVSSRRARVTYHFTDKPGARRGSPALWKPRYSAPARIVEVPVRFRFRDVPLP